MGESLTIFDMVNMKIKQHENGFSLWMLEPCDDGELREKCLIDGSLVKESGEIKLNNKEHRMFQPIYHENDSSIKIKKFK
ncbi:hypothetical protein GCM10009430_31870 [Aquimarina litoralis]|uniref:Uncharacterized protein n=1 Tax=Aquimarina litoralis TaxID=584605 RepID=A0ABP3UAP6_9FLAO